MLLNSVVLHIDGRTEVENSLRNVSLDLVGGGIAAGLGAKRGGILFYPGHDPYYREQKRGVQAPISSIRTKNLHRGIQDYEYMWLAASKGKRDQVDHLVSAALPKMLHETDRTHPISWSPHGNDWDEYRKKMIDLIV